jgi:hypothetical protein
MTTFPLSESHLTFEGISAHLRAQSAATPPQTAQSAQDRLIARYTAIRPILAALSVIPLLTWRAGLVAFMATADEVALLTQAPIATEPTPVPANPDFKAGKDQ